MHSCTSNVPLTNLAYLEFHLLQNNNNNDMPKTRHRKNIHSSPYSGEFSTFKVLAQQYKRTLYRYVLNVRFGHLHVDVIFIALV